MDEWLASQGISNMNAYSPSEQLAIKDSYSALNGTIPDMSNTMSDFDKGAYLANSNTNTSANGSNLFGISGLNGNTLSGLSSLGGLALNAIALPSMLDTYKSQNELLQQQIKSNAQALDDKNTFNSTWANASNSLGSGYASKASTTA